MSDPTALPATTRTVKILQKCCTVVNFRGSGSFAVHVLMEASWTPLGRQLERTWGQLGRFGGQLGANLGALGTNLGALGANLEAPGANLGALGTNLSRQGRA